MITIIIITIITIIITTSFNVIHPGVTTQSRLNPKPSIESEKGGGAPLVPPDSR